MEHTAKGNPKILKKCRLPYTAVHCITKIITEMCVINVTDKGLELVEINPEFTVEQVQAATEATLIVSPDLRPGGAMRVPPPTACDPAPADNPHLPHNTGPEQSASGWEYPNARSHTGNRWPD